MARVLTFGTLKGGVGKTMLCFQCGGLLAGQGRRVLLIDGDLQGNLTNNLGIDRTARGLGTTFDIYNLEGAQLPPEQLVREKPIPALPLLDVIPGSMFLHKAELKLVSVAGREQILRNYFSDYQDFFDRYDLILIDTNPSMSIVNQNAFFASDTILLVCDVSMNSIEGAQLFLALWEDARRRLRCPDNIRGLVVNDYDARNKLSSDFMEFLHTAPETQDLRGLLLDTVIPRNVRLTESELAATPISVYDAKSRGCIAFSALVAELQDKGIL